MKPTLKKKWVEALRSGDYKQGRDYLRNASNAFCCLGVLCDIVDPSGWIHKPDHHNSVYSHNKNGLTSLDVKFLLGVGLLKIEQNTLIDMNDDTCEDFGAIANWIEKNL